MHLTQLTVPQMIVIVVAAVILIAVIARVVHRGRTERLRTKFGEAEYDRTMAERGSNSRAEAELEQRTKRVQSFHLRELTPADRGRFQEAWANVQARFVDGPAGAVTEADRLVGDVMAARGYPTSDFETRAADVSVDHPLVVQNYRAGHEIAVRHLQGDATTEDLRRAMIYYRALFEDLLGEPAVTPATVSSGYQMPPTYGTR